ncbi:MAG TPA: CpsB/CapC family capsule biosynthesis tyrosine phosphatase [Solirubrobacteraceae bacterium]
MIDLHCHVLPALDDGALDLADSLRMLSTAERDGIEVVCATPHIRDDHDVRIEELPARVAALQDELDRRSISVRVARGGEVAQPDVEELSDEHLNAVSLDGGGWILLEPGSGAIAADLPDSCDRLIERGFRVILAHPERHAGAGFEARLRELASRGVLLQWTAAFIEQCDPGDESALVPRLAREGLIHLIASDAHSSHGGRPLRLSGAVARLREICSAEQLTWIVERAPRAILSGADAPARW